LPQVGAILIDEREDLRGMALLNQLQIDMFS
jgi:hypothetical protein